MAVQALNNKKIIVRNNISTIVKDSNRTVVEDKDIYGETNQKSNQNIDIDSLSRALIANLSAINPGVTKAIDVDIKREIAIGKVSKNAVKSEMIVGKVNNKLDKLKALRNRNGS
tara:strand:+ start:76 stop:417 length:342 start_codon:yes stop_codon:yes gene_type:complete